MYYSLFIHSPTEEHLGCFDALPIVINDAMNEHWGTYVFFNYGLLRVYAQ